MKVLVIALALLAGQMITMQDKPVAHLKPNTDGIEGYMNGMRLELNRSPAVIHLPKYPPQPDGQGVQWTVDIKNFGPQPVTVMHMTEFKTVVAVNQTVHIYSTGAGYTQKTR